MKHTKEDQALALAGIFQATYLVQQIARNGKANSASQESILESLFKFDVPAVADVYGNVSGVVKGLRVLKTQLAGKGEERDLEITRYAIALLHLERKLSKDKDMLEKIRQGLATVQDQMSYFSLNHESTIAKIADIYQKTISTLLPRIVVQGEHLHLSNADNANKIRALLLAGIRSAVLWRQCGGNRWQFLFSRKIYLQATDKLLAGV